MPITSLYSSLLAIIFLILTYKVIKIRRNNKIAIGDNNNLQLQKAIRAQGNFTETVPLALILMSLAESGGSGLFSLHLAGSALLLGRMLHSYGISLIQENLHCRITGMALTLTVIIFLLLINLSHIF